MRVFRSSKTAAVWAVAAVTCLAIPANAVTSRTTWQNFPFTAQSGTFTATFDAAASAANIDGVIALSSAAVSSYSQCAVLVRFNSDGVIDVRDGGSYVADAAVPYTAGTNYRFRVAVDTAARTYSVFVTPTGGTEVALASGCAFRTEQATASSLANWAMIAEPGSVNVNNFQAGAAANPGTDPGTDPGTNPGTTPGTTSTTTWRNMPFAAQTGSFTAEFDAVPNAANMDGVTALSASGVSSYNQCPVLIRFNSSGQIDVRSGGSYAANVVVPYAAGKSYHFRVAVNVPGKTYSVYVTPAGGTEQMLASNYAFRTEAASMTSLANWAMIAEPGTHTVSNFKATGSTQPTTLKASAGADKTIASGQSTTLTGSASGGTAPYTYSWSPTTGLSSATVASPTASPTATTTYTLTVRDAAGQSATDSVVITVSAPVPALAANAGADKTITAGQATTLTGSASGGTAPYTYGWSPTTGLSSATVASPTANPIATTTYTLTVRDAAGKTATDSVVVTVNPGTTPGTTSRTTWQNFPFAAQTGNFTAEFDAVPNAANMDGVTGLSTSAVSSYNQCPVLIRFNSAGVIDVRNGGSYGADAAMSYAAGKSYHFRVAVNVPGKTYSVYVTPAGGTEQTLASNYAFRTEAASMTSLANWAMIAEPGTHTVSNFKVTATAAPALAANAGADKTISTGGSTTLSGSASGGAAPYTYSWSPTTGLSSATVATPTASPTATTTYTLTVRDAAGKTATDSVVVTVSATATPLTASAGADKTITSGQSTTLAGSASGGTSPYTYSWTPTTGLSSATVAAPTASPTTTTTYTLTVRDAAGKTATDSVVVTVGTSTTPSGTVYYVSPSGNDSNNGSSSAPWRTLSKAASTATAGTTVIVKAGTYYESLNPSNSGQAGKLITFKSETPRGAIIDGQRSRGTGVNLNGRPYIRIEGFDIRYHTSAGMSLQDYSGTSSVGVQVINNYIHHTGDYTSWQGGGFGIQASNVKDCLIEGNEITYNGDTAIRTGGSGYQTTNLTIRSNNIHYNGRDGISGGGNNVIVEFNFMHDQCHSSLHSDGVELSMANGFIFRYNTIGDFTQLVYGGPNEGEPQPIANIQVYGNVFYDSLYWSRKGGTCPAFFIDCRRTNMGNNFSNIYVHSNTFLYLGDSQKAIILYGAPGLKMNDVRIFNNIFYQCRGSSGGYAYDIDSRFTNVVSDYNCFYNTEPVAGKDAHSIFVNPQLVNYSQGALNFDAHLRAGSPCINTGPSNLGSLVPLPSGFKDRDGKSRPIGGYDFGAYEQ